MIVKKRVEKTKPNDTFGLIVYVELYVTGVVKRNLSEAILITYPKHVI